MPPQTNFSIRLSSFLYQSDREKYNRELSTLWWYPTNGSEGIVCSRFLRRWTNVKPTLIQRLVPAALLPQSAESDIQSSAGGSCSTLLGETVKIGYPGVLSFRWSLFCEITGICSFDKFYQIKSSPEAFSFSHEETDPGQTWRTLSYGPARAALAHGWACVEPAFRDWWARLCRDQCLTLGELRDHASSRDLSRRGEAVQK